MIYLEDSRDDAAITTVEVDLERECVGGEV